MRKLIKRLLPAPLRLRLVRYNERRNRDIALRQFFNDLQEQKCKVKPFEIGSRAANSG